MKTFTVYRTHNGLGYGHDTDNYIPVRRGGKSVTFRTKPEAEKWIEDNPVKSTAEIPPRYEVRRTIKRPKY